MRLDNILRSSTTQLSELAHSVQMIQELWSEIVTLTHGSYAPETFLWTFAATFNRSALSAMKPVASD
jgi:hypothetical protein